MRIGKFERFCELALPAHSKFLVVGPPGVGKTQVPADVARRLGWDYIPICCPLTDPSFWMGYPYRNNGTAGFAPYGQIAAALAASKPTLLVLDEFGAMGETTTKACLRFVQFGEVGDKRLPDCVMICAASNDVGHGAGVMGLLEPMKDRFATIISVEPHVEDTIAYGLANDWPAWLLAYLQNSGPGETSPYGALLDWKPTKNMGRSGATPRGWGEVAVLDKSGLLDFDPEVICGAVGRGRGLEALAFRDQIQSLPDINQVLSDPAAAPIPDNPSHRYFVALGLAAKLNGRNFGVGLTYLNRLPQAMRAFSVRAARRREYAQKADGKLPAGYKMIHESVDHTAWAVSQDGREIVGTALG